MLFGKTRSILGKRFLHPQKYALPYTYKFCIKIFLLQQSDLTFGVLVLMLIGQYKIVSLAKKETDN